MKNFIFLFILSFLFISNSQAANRYWIAQHSGNWGNSSNWSSKSGGSPGASVPGANDKAFFDNKGLANCILDVNINVKGIDIDNKYTGSVIQSNHPLSIGTNDFKMDGGSFFGSAQNIMIEGNLTLTGGIFKSTSESLYLKGNLEFKGGTFEHNNGKLVINGIKEQNLKLDQPAQEFYTVVINMHPAKKLKINNNDTLIVKNLLQCVFGRTDNGHIAIFKSLEVDTYWNNGSSKISFLGSGNSNMITNSNCWDIDDVVIDKLNQNDTLFFKDGDNDKHIEMGNVNRLIEVKKGVLAFDQGVTVNLKFKEINILPGGAFNSSDSEVAFQGDFYNNGGKFSNNNGTFRFNGNGNRTIELSNSSQNLFNNVIIDLDDNKKLTVSNGDTLFCSNNLILKNGKIQSGIVSVNGNVEVQNDFDGGTATLEFAGLNEQEFNLINAEDKIEGDIIINKSNSTNVNLISDLIIGTNGQELILKSGYLVSSSTNLFTMADGTKWSGGSNNSYVEGPMKKVGNEAFEFPVGKQGYFAPLSISKPTKTTDEFQAEYFKENPGNYYNVNSKEITIDHISSAEYWSLDRITGSANVLVTLSWDTGRSGAVTDMAEVMAVRWDASQAEWKDHGNGGTTGSIPKGTVSTLSSTTNFGPFSFGSTSMSNPLPIELVELDANYSNGNIDIYWITASEVNNDYFEIQKSKDGSTWDIIESVKGAGNSNRYIEYHVIDNSPFEGKNYYRLRQVDYNGNFEYTDAVSVNVINFIEKNNIIAYPNPTANTVNLRADGLDISNLTIYDSNGVEVNAPIVIKDGEINVDLSVLPTGLYLIKSNTLQTKIYKK